MPTLDEPKCYCKTCQRLMDAGEFYKSNNIEKYPPNGRLDECKKCITRHVDSYNPETFKWILEKIDVPYIEEEWATLLERYGKDRKKMTGTTILGRYLAKMKIIQYKNARWADTDRIAEERKQAKRDSMLLQGYSAEDIDQAIEDGVMLPPRPKYLPPVPTAEEEAAAAAQEDELPNEIDILDPGEDFQKDLTPEDVKYLTIKWGRNYKPYEWVQLEEYYQSMMQAFDIVTPSHKDYLKLICKTSLKMHQCIDLGDIEGFQKLSRVYDSLMKSAKFTALQNKAESGEYVSAINEFILLCEREAPIPRFYTPEPQDKVDETLADIRRYTQRLVIEEQNLGNLIENAMHIIQEEDAKQEDAEVVDDIDLELHDLENPYVVSDEDFEEQFEFVESQKQEDADMIDKLLETQ